MGTRRHASAKPVTAQLIDVGVMAIERLAVAVEELHFRLAARNVGRERQVAYDTDAAQDFSLVVNVDVERVHSPDADDLSDEIVGVHLIRIHLRSSILSDRHLGSTPFCHFFGTDLGFLLTVSRLSVLLSLSKLIPSGTLQMHADG